MKKLKHFKGFTLVELIIVITILSILATIAFISFKNFTSNSRDSNRLATLSSIEKGLTLFGIQAGKYPMPDGDILYSGSINGEIFTYKGNIAENITRVIKINKIPTDPLSNTNYIYGTTADGREYQIAGTLENLQANNLFISEVYADAGYSSKVNGTYKGKISFSSGGLTYIANIPSLLWSGELGVNLLISSGSQAPRYIIDKGTNIAYHPKNGNITQEELSNQKTPDQVIQEKTKNPNTKLIVVSKTQLEAIVKELKENTGTSSTFESLKDSLGLTQPQELITSFGVDTAENLDVSVLGNTSTTTSTQAPVPNSCATQPTYTNATFTTGTPTQVGQVWQSTNSSNPCYWTCGSGKTLVGNDCVSENCGGTDPNTINATSNATSTAGGTWDYNPGGGLCSFDCNANYTWNGSNACTDQTPPPNGDFTMPATTNSTSVTLTITCPTDVISGTNVQMYLSGAGLSTGGGVWENCASSKNITVTTGDGSKAITMKWRDSAGNETAPVISKNTTLNEILLVSTSSQQSSYKWGTTSGPINNRVYVYKRKWTGTEGLTTFSSTTKHTATAFWQHWANVCSSMGKKAFLWNRYNRTGTAQCGNYLASTYGFNSYILGTTSGDWWHGGFKTNVWNTLDNQFNTTNTWWYGIALFHDGTAGGSSTQSNPCYSTNVTSRSFLELETASMPATAFSESVNNSGYPSVGVYVYYTCSDN